MRTENDTKLGVKSWPTPGRAPRFDTQESSGRAKTPDWWHGDQEASDSFMAAMGIVGL